jgi:hypothetical protein
MAVYAVTSDDTITIGNRALVDLADADTTKVDIPNDMADVKTGKNGNGIISRNRQGDNANVTLRLVRGSSDDAYMQNLLTAARNNWVGQTLLKGQFIKMLGDGNGNVVRDIYSLSGGVFLKNVAGLENVNGETEQAVAVYELKFVNVSRSLQ